MKIDPRSLLLLVVLLAMGCAPAPKLQDYDSRQAEETLILALEAWKHGRVDTLAKHDPPVRFEDEDYRSGFRLTDYRVDRRAMPLRAFEDVPVVLFLRDRRGRTVEETVSYQVTLAPNPAVLRNDY